MFLFSGNTGPESATFSEDATHIISTMGTQGDYRQSFNQNFSVFIANETKLLLVKSTVKQTIFCQILYSLLEKF